MTSATVTTTPPSRGGDHFTAVVDVGHGIDSPARCPADAVLASGDRERPRTEALEPLTVRRVSSEAKTSVDVVVVGGAGFAGLYALHKFRSQGAVRPGVRGGGT